jgi:hypothetical protein
VHSWDTSGTVNVPLTSSPPLVPIDSRVGDDMSLVCFKRGLIKAPTFPVHHNSAVVNGKKSSPNTANISRIELEVQRRPLNSLSLTLTQIDISFNFRHLGDLCLLVPLFSGKTRNFSLELYFQPYSILNQRPVEQALQAK